MTDKLAGHTYRTWDALTGEHPLPCSECGAPNARNSILGKMVCSACFITVCNRTRKED